MEQDFVNRVITITGAAGNLGIAVAHTFQSAGAKLALVDRSPERLSKIFPDLVNSAEYFFAPATDVTEQNSVVKTIEAIHHRFGRIDVLINTAGGYRAGTPLHQTPLSDWEFMLSLNARSVFITCQAVIPYMLNQGYGKIVSIASRGGFAGGANQAAYSASKAAVVRLTESMSAELKDAGINVNCVAPGLIDTPQNRAAMPDADYSKWVSPKAVAEVILFLASDAARAIHGIALPV